MNRPVHRYGRPATLLALLTIAACAPKGEALYARAQDELDKGDVGAAVIDLKNLLEAEPQNAKARALLAAGLLESGDLQGSEIEIHKAKDLGAPVTETMATECRVLVGKREYQTVLDQCSAQGASAATRALVLISRGQALLGLQRPDEARAQFELAAADRPRDVDVVLGLASSAFAKGGLPAARAVLDKADSAVKGAPRYSLALGELALQGGDFPAAEQAFRQAADKAGGVAGGALRLQALVGLAESQLRQSRLKEAGATAAELAKAAPDNNFVKVLRARVAATGGKYEDARTLLDAVLSAEPANYNARLLLGMVNVQQGNLGQAEMNFANVVANQPDNVRAQRLLAEARSRMQSPKQALESLKPALEHTSDPSLLAMAGRLSLASGDRQQALAYFSQASAQPAAEASPEVQLEVASGYVAAGDYDRAIDLLRMLPPSTGGGYQRDYLLMGALLRKGDKEGAVAVGKELVERSGNDPAARNLVAAAYEAAGQRDAGREQLAKALALKPNDPQTLINLARLDLAEGKSAEAEARFRKVLDVDANNLEATLGAAMAAGIGGDAAGAERWLLKATSDHPDSTPARMALIRHYLGARNFAKAQVVIDEAIKKSPNDAALANASGLVRLAGGDAAAALASFERATKLAPTGVEYTLNLARAHLVNRDVRSGLAVLDQYLAANPKALRALQLAAAMALQGREYEKAAGYTARLRQAVPDSPLTDRLDGDLALAQKNYRDALKSYTRAARNGTDRELVLATYRAASLAGAADAEKGLADWLAAHPDDGAVVTALAEARRGSGGLDDAATLYERGVAKAPGNAIMLNNLAVVYQQKGDARALETARKAYELAPKVAAIQDTYAWILVDAGRSAEAVKLLEQAVAAAPQLAEIQYHYAVALANAGNQAAALPALRKALDGQLAPAVRTDAQKLLQRLSK